MKTDNTVHIKLEYDEAVESKRDILETQVSIIKIAQTLRKYKLLRERELTLKEDLLKKIKEAKTYLKKLHAYLPEPKLPKVMQEKKERQEENRYIKEIETKKPEKTKEKKAPVDGLEFQLKEIQERLNKLR